MKITKRQLKRIIKEERQKLLNESIIETLRLELSGVQNLAAVAADVNAGNTSKDDLYDAILWAVDEVLRTLHRDIEWKSDHALDDNEMREAFKDATELFLRDM